MVFNFGEEQVEQMQVSNLDKDSLKKMAKKCTGGFVDELRSVAMKLHTKDQSKEGQKETQIKPWREWDPTLDGYLKFLVDRKLIYDTLDKIICQADFPEYAEFRNTGLERALNLSKDLQWFKEQGHVIPQPLPVGLDYSLYIEKLSKNDPQAFICHLYVIYFGQTAGGRMIGRKVAAKLLNGKELEFYKWDGDITITLQYFREKLNKVAQNWTRDEKDHCLDEIEISFKFNRDIFHLTLV
ncbi:heme oxygenase 1, chloroplastic-like [Rutidosis leptorrhynchoides]|uniref:heme oxygenase 1, chloroplastic-like n=1 Tax=Rutidosis leptorrhynchoides TaxID=125765 RepID=UPI003A991761